ncbi:hypothetical protein ACRRTK_021897 [Alexandromys fortis]
MLTAVLCEGRENWAVSFESFSCWGSEERWLPGPFLFFTMLYALPVPESL